MSDKEVDLSGFDDAIAQEEETPVDLSGFDKEVDLSGFDEQVKPEEQPVDEGFENFKTAAGTGVGATVGGLLGSGAEGLALKGIAADMGVTKKLKMPAKQASKKAKELAKFALDKDIYGMFSGPQSQAEKVQDLLATEGKKQSSLYKEVGGKSTPIEELLQEYKSLSKPNISSTETEKVASFNNMINRLEKLKAGSGKDIPIKELVDGKEIQKTVKEFPGKSELSLEDLQNEKEKMAALAYDERSGAVKNTAKAEQAEELARANRNLIDKRIAEADALNPGSNKLAELKTINKTYNMASDLEPGVAKAAAKSLDESASLFKKIKGAAIDTPVRGVLKGVAKYGGPIGAVIGAGLGGISGALAADSTAGEGVVEALRDDALGPLAPERIANAEIPGSREMDKQIKEQYKAQNVAGGIDYVKSMQPAKQDNYTSMNKEADRLANLTTKAAGIKPAKASDKKDFSLGFHNTLMAYNPQNLQGLQQKIEASGKQAYQGFLSPLQKAVNSTDEKEKAATFFGLQQQPAFRQMLKDLGELDD